MTGQQHQVPGRSVEIKRDSRTLLFCTHQFLTCTHAACLHATVHTRSEPTRWYELHVHMHAVGPHAAVHSRTLSHTLITHLPCVHTYSPPTCHCAHLQCAHPTHLSSAPTHCIYACMQPTCMPLCMLVAHLPVSLVCVHMQAGCMPSCTLTHHCTLLYTAVHPCTPLRALTHRCVH